MIDMLGYAIAAIATCPNQDAMFVNPPYRPAIVYFKYDSTTVPVEQFCQLSQTLDSFFVMKRGSSDVYLAIQGHADRAGSDAYNLRLSCERALAMRDFLATGGVPRDKMVLIGFGETRPAADTPDGVPHRDNRRVELEIASRQSDSCR